MNSVYKFKPWARLSGDPQKVGETLEQIREQHGTLSPHSVVETAREKTSILHGYFEWSDSVAAEKHRESQASHLIRSIVVVSTAGIDITAPVRAFVSVKQSADESDENRPGSYISIAEAVRVVTYRRQMLHDALRDLDAYRTRYALLTNLKQWDNSLLVARKNLMDEIEKETLEEAALA